MKNWFKIFGKQSLVVLTMFTMVLSSACKKDGNPNNISDAVASDYERPANEGVIKILAIGNSFSEDAIETHLYDLAKEKGIKVIIGNMYIGGASLATHQANAERNVPIYEYRKINENGEKKIFLKTSLNIALEDEQWDYISFQQVSENSGQLETITAPLTSVFNYVKSKVKNPNVKYVYHQTWAYPQNSTQPGFANYNSNQITMYNAIVNVSKEVKNIVPLDIIVPSGTAIQNGRTSVLEDNFNRDGYHLSIPLGRYTAACTWFETIFKSPVVGMKYKPEGLSPFEVSIAQNAAHLAVLKPYEVTVMTAFQGGNGGPLTSSVLIDFGNSPKSESWNQISSFTAGSKISLKDSVNSYVGLSLTIINRFNGININGETVTNTPLNMPANVSSRNFFGSSKLPFSGIPAGNAVFTITGLDNTLTYNFSFYGSRTATNNRETKYAVSGTNQADASINTGSNATRIATVRNIKPDTEGKVTITVSAGVNNVTSEGFYYLNAAKITSNN
ncbi:hypothetical protein A5893_10535 [Pedobacter psychrophilus]|uniref:DUF4886 domain-containing protein n=1 Tax=Pedobacter psychrophilus TaxID=1826909 RepID=A0A179DF21_9SPHI|nr:DUF4886 domain-containing protein [Pedobacter psychrophilus]OAQ39099.1 hypothetical protein A5893_10535 [Pedobacter psychrophilus]